MNMVVRQIVKLLAERYAIRMAAKSLIHLGLVIEAVGRRGGELASGSADEGVEFPPVVQAVVADDAPGSDAVVVVGAGMGSSGMISRTTKAPSGALRTTWMSPSSSRLT
jgi:hypothetical protein